MLDGERKGTEKRAEKAVGTGCACSYLFLFGLPFLAVVVYFFLVAIGGILIVADPIEPVNAVVILSGDDGDRLGMAVDLRERGFVDSLVITNTNLSANRRLVREARDAGFPESVIFVTDLAVDSTLDEAQSVLDFAQNRGWTALMVVTDPYHSFRTRVIFRQVFRGTGISISVRPVVGHWFRSTNWFLQKGGWNYVFMEVVKLLNFLIFHR